MCAAAAAAAATASQERGVEIWGFRASGLILKNDFCFWGPHPESIGIWDLGLWRIQSRRAQTRGSGACKRAHPYIDQQHPGSSMSTDPPNLPRQSLGPGQAPGDGADGFQRAHGLPGVEAFVSTGAPADVVKAPCWGRVEAQQPAYRGFRLQDRTLKTVYATTLRPREPAKTGPGGPLFHMGAVLHLGSLSATSLLGVLWRKDGYLQGDPSLSNPSHPDRPLRMGGVNRGASCSLRVRGARARCKDSRSHDLQLPSACPAHPKP